MDNILKQAMEVRHSHSPKDKKSMEKQQDYYRRLKKNGIAIQQTYNVSPVSAI